MGTFELFCQQTFSTYDFACLLRQGPLTEKLQLDQDLQFSCLHFSSAEIMGVHHTGVHFIVFKDFILVVCTRVCLCV